MTSCTLENQPPVGVAGFTYGLSVSANVLYVSEIDGVSECIVVQRYVSWEDEIVELVAVFECIIKNFPKVRRETHRFEINLVSESVLSNFGVGVRKSDRHKGCS
jgi:hypothetical protein